jgi:hypothetical protein
MRGSHRAVPCAVLALSLFAHSICVAQDLEPRRWTHLPTGTDILGAAYAFTTGDIAFDPVLLIADATVELHTLLLSYTRYFPLAGRTGRIDLLVPIQSGRWDGLVDGVPTSVSRTGLADPILRLSTLLIGGLSTSVGAALDIRFPLGEYEQDKLINLGQNRFAIAPQIGVLHTRGEWSFELTASSFFYTDNAEFFGSNDLAQDPLPVLQTHVVRTFGQSFWLSLGVAYGWGGESTVDDVPKDDEKSNLLFGPSFGIRIDASQSLRFSYVRTDALTDIGTDSHNLVAGWNFRF